MSADTVVDLVLVPTDLEGALECAVIGPRLTAEGLRVRWGVEHPGSSLRAWDWLPAGLPETTVDQDHGTARYLLLSGSHEASAALARAKGRERILLRPTGVDAFRSFRRGYPRMYRALDRILMRSRLEVAELGDRPHRLLPSGAALGLAVAGRTGRDHGETTVFVGDEVLGLTDPRGWLDDLVARLRALGHDPARAGTERACRELPGVTSASRHPELLTGTVLLAACPEVALVRALGGAPVVVTHGFDPAHFSPVWVDAHRPCDLDRLGERLQPAERQDRSARSAWYDELAGPDRADSAETWTTALVAALG